MSTEIAQDAHAEQRLHQAPVSVHLGRTGVIAAYHTDGVSIAVHADTTTPPGDAHEALAAMYRELEPYLGVTPRGGDD